MGLQETKPSGFAAKTLAPLIDARVASGKPLRIINGKVMRLPRRDEILVA